MKTASTIFLTFLLANMFVGALTLNVAIVSAENNGVVGAWFQRNYRYDADAFEDSVLNEWLNGFRWRSHQIRPQGEEVAGARIEMMTPHPYIPQTFPWIGWTPAADFTVEGPVNGNYTFEWDFGTIFEQANVGIRTTFPVTFKPNFACERIWNPWITADSVTQSLTIKFTPYAGAGGVHIQVRPDPTHEATATVVPDSNSSSPSLLHEEYWLEDENGQVANWGGDPVIGATHTFSVDLTVVNNFYPEPVYYKPSVGIGVGAIVLPEPETEITADYVRVWDDIDDDGNPDPVTFYGTGDFNWEAVLRDETGVNFPAYGSRFPFVAEGRAFVKLADGFAKGSAYLGIGIIDPNTVYLNVDGHGFWWGITEINMGVGVATAKCTPATGPPGTPGDPGPAPITFTASTRHLEEGGKVTVFGTGVSFSGRITQIGP